MCLWISTSVVLLLNEFLLCVYDVSLSVYDYCIAAFNEILWYVYAFAMCIYDVCMFLRFYYLCKNFLFKWLSISLFESYSLSVYVLPYVFMDVYDLCMFCCQWVFMIVVCFCFRNEFLCICLMICLGVYMCCAWVVHELLCCCTIVQWVLYICCFSMRFYDLVLFVYGCRWFVCEFSMSCYD